MVLLVAAGAWLLHTRSPDRLSPGRSFPLTSEPGIEQQVNLSPDGAFAVYGARRTGGCEAVQLYVKPVLGGEPRLLSRHCTNHYWPRWSPDGAFIAYARAAADGIDICVVPATGGEERQLARVIGPALLQNTDTNWVAWMADSKSLIVADRSAPSAPFALHILSLDTRARRQLTHPPPDAIGDTIAAASPDGQSVAFVRKLVGFNEGLFVMSLAGGEPRRLTFDRLPVNGLAWTPDSRDILFSSRRLSALNTLWRIPASGSDSPSRVGGVVDESVWPSAANLPGGRGLRIAYQSVTNTINMMRWDIAQGPDAKPAPVCPSTLFDWHAQFSPDGRRIAFSSNRAGPGNIWICEAGGLARQVTSFTGAYTDSPRWSPDGRRLLLTSLDGESREVFLADLDTAQIRALTHEPSDEGRASFSRDGNWIYFRSNRSGRSEIWKMAASGGPATQITRSGAMEGFESPDGKLLYFAKERPLLGVWSVPAGGGDEVWVAGGVRDTRWSVASDGIYFVTHKPPYEIMVYRFASRKTERLYRIPEDAAVWAGFTASFDGASVIWPQTVRETSDLMILDGVQ